NLDNTYQKVDNASIVLDGEQFYLINEKIDRNDELIFIQNNIFVNGEKHISEPLDKKTMQKFYKTIVPNLVKLVTLLLITSIISISFGYLQRYTGAFVIVNATKEVRYKAMERIQYLPLEMIESEPAGKTANRIIADSSSIASLYITTLNIFFSTIVSVIFCYVGMWILEPRLALICLIIVPIMVVWIKLFTTRVNVIATRVNETNSKMIGQINEIINGISILKIFNRDEQTIESFANLNDEYVEDAMKELKTHIKFGWNGINIFQGFVTGTIIIFFAYMNLTGRLIVGAGVVYAYYTYLNKLISPIGVLFKSFGELENSKVKVNRIFRLFESEIEDKEIVEIPQYEGHVSFDNVSFSYNQKNKVLKNITLDIKAGEKIGLVGHTGSGKSTMMNLLMRFNDMKEGDDGEIYIDETPIKTHSKRTYRQHIGIILQEPILFSGSIYDNICFGKEVTREVATKTLIKVGGQKLLDKLENGIDDKLSRKGNNLSLGEKQLISFARILVSNPSVIIMDEATANIDTETEEMINNALKVITKNRTTIVIAHRLSTIVDSDQIIVLNQGEIIESGKHKHLLNLDGYYANMYRAQVS
ncbi:MAG: ABC transporter ATP-binding protein, partial [Spiroplasma sp.]|nr:ABC transporter ATP-binding protein [Mycoplasmatales bacterium]